MTESSLFQEIDEDLQRKRMEALWKRYGSVIIGAALAIVLATALVSGWKSWRTYTEQKMSGDFLAIIEGPNMTKAEQAEKLEAFARTYAGSGQAALARLRAASLQVKDGNLEKAVVIYDELAKDAAVEQPFRQLADLLSVQTQMDSGDPAALMARLEPLTSNSPWHLTAKEYSALLAMRTGDNEKARKLLMEVAKHDQVPSPQAQRANDLLRLLDEGS